MRIEDDLLWEALGRMGWGLRWLRHVVAAAALAGLGGLLWSGGERLLSVTLFCAALVYAIWATVYWLWDRRRLVRVTVTDGGVRSIRLHRVNGRTTDHDPRMVTRVHITHRGWCYEDRDDPDVRAGRGSATLRLQVAGLRFISRSTGLDSEELDRVQRSWRTICPKAAIDTKRIPGQFAGYSY